MAGKKRRRRAIGTPQYTTSQVFGFSPTVSCWCGASFTIAMNANAGPTWDARLQDMYERLNDFYDQHQECTKPVKQEDDATTHP